VFCRGHRNMPRRVREGRELERSTDLGALVCRRYSRLVAVDFLSRPVIGADPAAIADTLALGSPCRTRLVVHRPACRRRPPGPPTGPGRTALHDGGGRPWRLLRLGDARWPNRPL